MHEYILSIKSLQIADKERVLRTLPILFSSLEEIKQGDLTTLIFLICSNIFHT